VGGESQRDELLPRSAVVVVVINRVCAVHMSWVA
jgi:hypothetical protein